MEKNLIFKKADLKAKKSSLENLTPSSYWSKQDLLSLCSVLSTPIGVQGGGQSAAPPPPPPQLQKLCNFSLKIGKNLGQKLRIIETADGSY